MSNNLEDKLSEEQLDKMLKKYFFNHFKDSKWYIRDNWEGFFLPNVRMILGRPYASSTNNTLYSDGTYWGDDCFMLGITPSEFNGAMLRYVNRTYGMYFNRLV